MNNLKSILVTGGAGYVGSVVVKKLVEEGFNVTVIDSLIFGKDGISDLLDKNQIKLFNLDLRETQKIENILKNIDCVIHLAAIVGEPLCKKIPNAAEQINEFVTKNLALLCKKNNVKRFIFASTCSNYGTSSEVVDETSPTQPLSLYSKTKVNSEKFILNLKSESFEPCIFRFATAYGLSPRMRFDLLVQEFIRDAIVDNKISIFGADFWRPFIHVEDMATACICAINADSNLVSGEIYNVGNEKENYTKISLANIIEKFLPSIKIEIVESKNDLRSYKVSFEKIKNNLNFSPKYSIENTVEKIIEKIHLNKLNPKDSEFSNISRLTENVKPFENYHFDESL